ncbi:MAG: hypothetical protein IKF36_02670 [Bacilli bacterium]|nr:hypothetical protein [Bacilli bacterium]
MKKKVIIFILLFIIVVLGVIATLILTGKIGKKKTIDSCKDCVFARYYKDKEIGDELTDYESDYTSIKNIDSKKIFLGHKLDSNNKIETGYVCGITNGKAFCVEGSETAYESNKKVLNDIFGNDNCTEKTFSGSTYYTCGNKEIYSTIYSYGSATVSESKSNMCTYSSSDVMSCYDGCVLNGTCE